MFLPFNCFLYSCFSCLWLERPQLNIDIRPHHALGEIRPKVWIRLASNVEESLCIPRPIRMWSLFIEVWKVEDCVWLILPRNSTVKWASCLGFVLTFSISKWDSQQFPCTCSDLLQFPIWLDKKTRNFLAWNPNVHFSWLNCTLYFLVCSNTSFRWRYDILLWRWEKHKREVELCWLFLAFS
jgi:hypothetical protein